MAKLIKVYEVEDCMVFRWDNDTFRGWSINGHSLEERLSYIAGRGWDEGVPTDKLGGRLPAWASSILDGLRDNAVIWCAEVGKQQPSTVDCVCPSFELSWTGHLPNCKYFKS